MLDVILTPLVVGLDCQLWDPLSSSHIIPFFFLFSHPYLLPQYLPRSTSTCAVFPRTFLVARQHARPTTAAPGWPPAPSRPPSAPACQRAAAVRAPPPAPARHRAAAVRAPRPHLLARARPCPSFSAARLRASHRPSSTTARSLLARASAAILALPWPATILAPPHPVRLSPSKLCHDLSLDGAPLRLALMPPTLFVWASATADVVRLGARRRLRSPARRRRLTGSKWVDPVPSISEDGENPHLRGIF